MGNKSKSEKYLPADPTRIRAFAFQFAHSQNCITAANEPDVRKLLNAIATSDWSFDISEQTLRKWFSGVDFPRYDYVKLVEKFSPNAGAWLIQDLNENSLRRFLCAIDIWGSLITSNERKINNYDSKFSAYSLLQIIASKWAPTPIYSGDRGIKGFAIPRLRTYVPKQLLANVYIDSNPLTTLDFILRLGQYIDLSDASIFDEWSVDLAATALTAKAYFESLTIPNQMNSGRTGDYAGLLYNALFMGNDNWPTTEKINGYLEKFNEIETPAKLSDLIMNAREVLSRELSGIGRSLNLVEEIFDKIPDKNIMWQGSFIASRSVLTEEILIAGLEKSIRNNDDKFDYILKHEDGVCRVLTRVRGSEQLFDLPRRTDLFDDYQGEFSWGYEGSGPQFLTVSLLAHHFGHPNFHSFEFECVLDKVISALPGGEMMGPFLLTTEIIDSVLDGTDD